MAADGSYTLTDVPGGEDIWLQVNVPGFLRKSLTSPLNLKNNIVQVDFIGIKPDDYDGDGKIGKNGISEWYLNCSQATGFSFPDSRYDRLCDFDLNGMINEIDEHGAIRFDGDRADD